MAGMRARNVLMVYPRFVADSFFNFRAACEAIGRRSAAAPLGLITVAALLPPEWSVRFLDRNVEELTERDLVWADLVMTGGMIVQQRDTLDIIRMCRARAIPVDVGGRMRPPVRMSIAKRTSKSSVRPKTSWPTSSRRSTAERGMAYSRQPNFRSTSARALSRGSIYSNSKITSL